MEELEAQIQYYERCLEHTLKLGQHYANILKHSAPHKLQKDKDDLGYDDLLKKKADLEHCLVHCRQRREKMLLK